MEGKPHKKKFRLFEFFIVAGVSDPSQLQGKPEGVSQWRLISISYISFELLLLLLLLIDGKAKGEVVGVLPKPSQDEEVLLRDISMVFVANSSHFVILILS